MLYELVWTQKYKYHMTSLICMIWNVGLIEEKTGGFHMVGRDRETSLIRGRIYKELGIFNVLFHNSMNVTNDQLLVMHILKAILKNKKSGYFVVSYFIINVSTILTNVTLDKEHFNSSVQQLNINFIKCDTYFAIWKVYYLGLSWVTELIK